MGVLERMVENQEQAVTVRLTDSLAEHEVLEALLDDSKPPVTRPLKRFDYLLRTPWRYPPLPWGSRFGRRFEPSLFYGSLTRDALLAEAAYYRFLFLEGMSRPFSNRTISQHTVFQARFASQLSYKLNDAPFARRAKALMHPADYSAAQALGTSIREAGGEVIQYWSARSAEKALNVALLAPRALRSRKHMNPQRCICETRADAVTFRINREVIELSRQQFLVAGNLPAPAS